MLRRLSDEEIKAINERVMPTKKENPFLKKKTASRTASTRPSGKNSVRHRSRQSSVSASTNSFGIVMARSKVNQARKRLFAADWKPHQLDINITDEQRELLIKLFVANRALTMAKIKVNNVDC